MKGAEGEARRRIAAAVAGIRDGAGPPDDLLGADRLGEAVKSIGDGSPLKKRAQRLPR